MLTYSSPSWEYHHVFRPFHGNGEHQSCSSLCSSLNYHSASLASRSSVLLHRTCTAHASGNRDPIWAGTATPTRRFTPLPIINPIVRLYHGVNCSFPFHEPIRSQLTSYSTTNFNVVISVLSVFILLCKAIAWITGVLHPLISLIVHAGLVALWAVSIHNQAAPDMSDPKHPQPGAPWYITKSCGPPISNDLVGYCKQAKGAFAVTVLMW